VRRLLTKDEFFFVGEDNYDSHAEQAIPYYRELHAEALRCLATEKPPQRVLDLGSGTGKTAHVFLRAFAGCKVRCVELFEEMQRHARERLEQFGPRVEHVLGDFMEVALGEGYDVCVSALAVHHQTAEGKRQLFRRIYDALAPNGRFLMIDWTRFETSTLQDLSYRVAEEHLRAHVEDQRVVDEWADHWKNKNLPETIEELTGWLRAAGFATAECAVRFYGMALICAAKSAVRP
jgi:cyclopropane fatty-acyl-phospholipid synthase-like methyltransferase